MKHTKLNSIESLVLVLNNTIPQVSCPKDFNGDMVEEFNWTKKSLKTGLENGGLSAHMNYGCWDIWKTENGYSGELLQYRDVTDKFTDKSIKYALAKAQEWASGCEGC